MIKSAFMMLLVVQLDTVPSRADLSLLEYCQSVSDYSHELLIADARERGAEADMRRSRKDYLPLVTFDRELNLDFSDNVTGRRWGWLTRAEVSQPIYNGGAVRAEANRAELALEVARCNVESSQLDVEYEAINAYWSLSRAEIYCRAMADYYNIVKSLNEVVARRFDEGYISKSDLLQVSSRLIDAEYQLSAAEQSRLVALHNFNLLRGVDPNTEVSLAESIFDTMYMPMRMSIEDVVTRRPDFQSAMLNVESSFWGIRAARAKFLPQINVGMYALMQPNMPHVKGGGIDFNWGAVVSFSTPIFHFGERRQSVLSARSRHEEAQYALDDVRDNISLQESDGWTNLQSTHARVEAVRRNLDVARENLDISTYSYHEGLATILDVLQAQLSWLQIYTNAIAAQYDYAMAIAAYQYITAD